MFNETVSGEQRSYQPAPMHSLIRAFLPAYARSPLFLWHARFSVDFEMFNMHQDKTNACNFIKVFTTFSIHHMLSDY